MFRPHDFAIHLPLDLPRKRQPSSLPVEDAEPPRRKQKVDHPTFPPPNFWDNLSKRSHIPLTKNALRELDRRNCWRERRDVAVHTPVRRSHRLAAQRNSTRDCEVIHLRHKLRKCTSHGGPDLTDLRGYCPPKPVRGDVGSSTPSSLGRRKRGSQHGSLSSEKVSVTANTTSTRSTGPYDRAFQQHLIDHGIFPDRYKYPDGRIPPRPDNLEDIRLALLQPRPSLSPSQFSEERFEAFQLADADASKGSQVMADVIPFIEGYVGDRKCMGRQVPLTNFDHLTDGTLAAASPDIYYGSRPEQLDRKIREELSGLLVPSTQEDLPVAPNFFVEVKGRDGTAAVANRQINYDTALGERAQNALWTYREPAQFDSIQAHTLGCTYLDGTLKMFATHVTEPSTAEARHGYAMTQIKAWALTGDAETFRKGAAAYRNGRDWAKRQRDEAIKKAHEKLTVPELNSTLRASGLGLCTPSAGTGETAGRVSEATTNCGSDAAFLNDSDTSADELFMGSPSDRRLKSTRKTIQPSPQGNRQHTHPARRVNENLENE